MYNLIYIIEKKKATNKSRQKN